MAYFSDGPHSAIETYTPLVPTYGVKQCPKGFYVYIYRDPRKDNVPFYIGRGQRYRYRSHLKETEENTTNIFKWRTIQSIRQETGKDPLVEIYRDDLTLNQASYQENYLIAKHGRVHYDEGGTLTNHLIDSQAPNYKKGEGPNLGKKFSDETKQRMSEALIRRYKENPKSHPFFGRHHTEASKAKMGIANKGRVKTPEDIAGIIARNTGRIRTSESKAKVSKSLEQFTYKIIGPDNTEYVITNLQQFCREHGLLNGNMVTAINHQPYLSRSCKGFRGIKLQALKPYVSIGSQTTKQIAPESQPIDTQ